MTQRRISPEKIQNMVRDRRLGLTVSEILARHLDIPLEQSEEVESRTFTKLSDENFELKQFIEELLVEIEAQAQHPGAADGTGDESAPGIGIVRTGPSEGKFMEPFTIAGPRVASHPPASLEPVSSLLNRSRIIPAIRRPEYLDTAIRSPSAIVWLLYGTPLTLPEIVRQVRSAGKLPIANLDLLTGFAHDGDGIELLAAEGVAGVVSTRQSVLRAARAQGIIAVQRTFIVDSIAVGNITRALQHFLPDAVELLPAAAAPLCVATLRAAQPQLPVIATGLVTSMRQVDDLVRCGVSSVATSDASLWVL